MTVKLVNYLGNKDHIEFYLTGNFNSLDPTFSWQEGVKYSLTVQESSFILEGNGLTHTIEGPLFLIPERYDQHHVVRINRRPYLGAMEFRLEDEQWIRPVNQLPLEDYLKGVVPFEVYPTWGIETLKAQSLAARTYAVTHMRKEMDDTISFQVYGGYAWYPSTTKAVEETRGEVVTFKNRLIEAFYSASNGGVTESNANVWGGNPIHYYPIKTDPYDPVHPWEFELHQTQINPGVFQGDQEDWWDSLEEKDRKVSETMKKWLERKGYGGDLKILSIPRFELSKVRRSSQRAVKGSIEVEFLERLIDGTVLFQTITLDDVPLSHIRPMLGGNLLKSYFIDSLTLEDDVFIMRGKGYGHGVGMSQWGAHYMAEKGKSYEDIIHFYFPGTTITHH
ncbi:SpoIID/LytB domain-containing protein [Ammoniphilus sp. CFH 90114]|uniref:SpoIID/LytB domain-containing protein n=1 Tax=Ammoniphilus sp. CFH 90114 TaxID=2493665 RepID=UPI001F0C7A43|nr:SpoIID/LytB domain-containing protein [Ammoniphilus sp. CFH 90114]